MIVGVMQISGGGLCLMFWRGWNASQRMFVVGIEFLEDLRDFFGPPEAGLHCDPTVEAVGAASR
jgi:hypothetical protein